MPILNTPKLVDFLTKKEKMSNPDNFICTGCSNPLQLTKRGTIDKSDDQLVCKFCGVQFPIVRGIPRFVPSDNYADSFGYQWNIHQRTQLDSYTGLLLSSDRLFGVSGWPKDLTGQRILEAGSGAGRFTEVLLDNEADVFSFDFSNAVDANKINNGSYPKLHLFQGDILDIPLPTSSFDKVICLGVLQHTPEPERSFKSLANYVKPGGELVIDVYKADWISYMHFKYLFRSITRHINKEKLYSLISKFAPMLIPFTKFMRTCFGRAGARLSPILEYSHLGLTDSVNREWVILDTFDMYSPTHDHPQTLNTVARWFTEAGFIAVIVKRGPNGIIGRGKLPLLKP